MREICMSGLMSGEGKRSVAAWPKPPRPSSTLLKSVHTLTPLSLTIATASLAPAHCVAAPMSLLPRVETEVTLPAI